MVFSSIMFLTRFLPLVLIVYFLVPGCMKNTWRNLVLFMFSLAFYAWGEPVYIWLMIFSTVVDYVNGGLAGYFVARDKRNTAKVFVGLSVVINLTLLAVFKYAGKFVLPIGISFYTFQSMSYTIDVYRGKAKAEKNPINFGAYISLFPQLIAGPIVRFSDIATQLRERTINLESIRYGMLRFVCGLGKKVLLANQAGEIFQTIANYKVSQMTTVSAWLGILAFMFQIYFDFSGYSDMAIGLMAVFGFEIPENFKYPYEAKSITEFWRQWHISLGNWFKEYVYIPLGGSRKGNARTFLNIFIVWFLTGLWHGTTINFTLWGLYFCFFLIMEKTWLLKLLDKIPRVFSHIYALVVVYFGWLLFAWEDIHGHRVYMKAMLGMAGAGVVNKESLYLLVSNALLMVIMAIGCTSLPKYLAKKVTKKDGIGASLCMSVYVAVILLLSIAYLVNGTYNPFLYFRF
ncbi:membrane bound O-acyl transferase MBOAT family protein [Roseburia sp. CAG:197]|nr:membrane bound O-acyl transferase MBOAT family protein [Roseburia sp. CAG:197]